jgi:hypothetical protein
VNQHATIEKVVSSPEEDLTQLELELSRELSSAKISEKRWQLQQRTELRIESPELAVVRIIEKKWQEMN